MIRALVPALVLVAVIAGHVWLAAGAPPSGFYADDAVYLLTAEHFAGTGGSLAEVVARRSHLPPLYPLLLALVGADGGNPLPGHLLNGLLLGIALALAYALHRRRQPRALALLGIVVVALFPGTLLHVLTLFSEPLYMTLSLASMLIATREETTPRTVLASGLLAGLALLSRGIGLALVAALLWRCARHAPRRLPLLVAAIALPVTGWWLLGPPRDPESGYWAILGQPFVRDGASALLTLAGTNLAALWQGWRGSIDLIASPVAGFAAGLVLLAVLFGLARRVRRSEVDALYVLAYLGALLLWPASSDHFGRFLLPLMPLAMGYAIDTLSSAARRIAPRGATPVLLAGVLAVTPALAAALPSITLITTRLAEPLPAPLADFQHSPWWLRNPDRRAALADVRLRAGTVHAARALRALVPADACLYARPVQLLMLHSRRLVVLPPPPGVKDWPRCEYVYAPVTLDNLVLMDGVVAGSIVIHSATLPGDRSRLVGQLFKLPGSTTDNARHARD